MKLPWLALLSIAAPALCQSPAQQAPDPDKLFQLPENFTQQPPRWGELKPQPFRWNRLLLPPNIVNPRPRLNNPQIDPKIIIRPPWHAQSKGHDVARHLYPNLKFLPLHRGPRAPR